MPQNNPEETKQNLLKAARAEFLEKGFMNASLRNICKNADCTTGALYFFFKDKEALFDAIVSGYAEKIKSLFLAHINAERSIMQDDPAALEKLSKMDYEEFKNKVMLSPENEMADDNVVAVKFFDLIYDDYESLILIVEKSAGTKYQHYLDDLIEICDAHLKDFTAVICKIRGIAPVDPYILHWLSHLMMETCIQLFTHISQKQKAMLLLPKMLHGVQSAFFSVFE